MHGLRKRPSITNPASKPAEAQRQPTHTHEPILERILPCRVRSTDGGERGRGAILMDGRMHLGPLPFRPASYLHLSYQYQYHLREQWVCGTSMYMNTYQYRRERGERSCTILTIIYAARLFYSIICLLAAGCLLSITTQPFLTTYASILQRKHVHAPRRCQIFFFFFSLSLFLSLPSPLHPPGRLLAPPRLPVPHGPDYWRNVPRRLGETAKNKIKHKT
ncbi:hypothetical protein IF1G_05720 [Cordyceps javanica]|uniref:Uncharacterized protein n=1 Tax=Cordyceps javanica TaxID=43265 RepID=A0A545V2F3_9HYPO|nr:hypothetical protein IF1G_05720 [Cordyceps javanica]